MPDNRVSFLAENSGTWSHLLRFYSGTDMSTKASIPGQVRFIVKIKCRTKEFFVLPKVMFRELVDLPVYLPG